MKQTVEEINKEVQFGSAITCDFQEGTFTLEMEEKNFRFTGGKFALVPSELFKKLITNGAEWISVEDKLPENEITVFVATQVGGTSTCFYTNGIWRYAISSKPVPPELIITHWQDLPKVPIK